MSFIENVAESLSQSGVILDKAAEIEVMKSFISNQRTQVQTLNLYLNMRLDLQSIPPSESRAMLKYNACWNTWLAELNKVLIPELVAQGVSW